MPAEGRPARDANDAPLAPGMRQTLPRRLVWEALEFLGPHRTAEELAAHIEARHVNIPRSSVYRALEALEASGAIRAVHFGGGPARYEPAGEPHQHAVCLLCHGVLHLENELIRDLEQHLERDHRFTPHRTDVTVVGICAYCAEHGGATDNSSPPRNLEHVHY